MELPEPIDEGLPAPRGDEPETLREDIVAELNDHLQCAFLRERHRSTDAGSAWRAVIQRFGSPRDMARQLWWENMKEQIMQARITIGLMALAVLACFGAVGVAWMTFNQMSESHAQNLAANQALLAKLGDLQTQRNAEPVAVTQEVSEWTTLRVRMVKAKPGEALQRDANGRIIPREGNLSEEDREPTPGIQVELKGKIYNSDQEYTVKETTDEEGWVKFGPLKVGKYNLIAKGDQGYRLSTSFVLMPAKEHVKTFLSPVIDRRVSPVRLTVDWPEDLRDAGILVCAKVRPDSISFPHDAYWSPKEAWNIGVDGQGKSLVEAVTGSSFGYYDPYPKKKEHFLPSGFDPQVRRRGFEYRSVEGHGSNRVPFIQNCYFQEGENQLASQMKATHDFRVGGYKLNESALAIPSGEGEDYRWVRLNPTPGVTFEAEPGEAAEWKIPFTDEMEKTIRHLQQQAEARAKKALRQKEERIVREKVAKALEEIPGVLIHWQAFSYGGNTIVLRPSVNVPVGYLDEFWKAQDGKDANRDPTKEELAIVKKKATAAIRKIVDEAYRKSAPTMYESLIAHEKNHSFFVEFVGVKKKMPAAPVEGE